jgi:hypothetical protein
MRRERSRESERVRERERSGERVESREREHDRERGRGSIVETLTESERENQGRIRRPGARLLTRQVRFGGAGSTLATRFLVKPGGRPIEPVTQ